MRRELSKNTCLIIFTKDVRIPPFHTEVKLFPMLFAFPTWLIYLAHLSEARLPNSQPCGSECASFFSSFWWLSCTEGEVMQNAGAGSAPRLASLFKTFINRGVWNVIPGLVHSTWLLQSFVCVYPFPVLWVTPVPLKPKLIPTCSGTGTMFL